MALRSMSAANCLHLDFSLRLRFPSSTFHSTTFHNIHYFRVCEYQFRPRSGHLPEYWNRYTQRITANCNIRMKFVCRGFSYNRPCSCSEGSTLGVVHADNTNGAVFSTCSPIYLFCDSQQDKLAQHSSCNHGVDDVDTGISAKNVTIKTPKSRKKGKAKSSLELNDHNKQVAQEELANNAAVDGEKLLTKSSVELNDHNKKIEQKRLANKAAVDGEKVLSAAGNKRIKRQHKKPDAPTESIDIRPAVAGLYKNDARVRNRVFTPLYPPSAKSVMVVESGTKAKTIQRYLGDMFVVIPSNGHVRDLAGRSGSVRPNDDFSLVWEVLAPAWTQLKTIKVALSGAENLILATDPDREGEAIAWHLIEMLKQQDALSENINVSRVVFHEITDAAIKNALQSPRDLDLNLINAYLARRSLDYLIGFGISPLLWKKLPGCRSAGRVQSAALALICDREMEIDQFKSQEYWKVNAEFCKSDMPFVSDRATISSQLTQLDSTKLDQFSISNQVHAESVKQRLVSVEYSVLNLRKRKMTKNPPMPYITSTLQQDAANRLHFTATRTMRLAQKLYEGVVLSDEQLTGLITYMRTDGLHISDAAANDIISLVRERYGDNFASKEIRKYFKMVKNAQEAHEAIRPTSIRRLPSTLKSILDDDLLKLYTLIWARTVACQMEATVHDLIQVDIGNAKGIAVFRSSASRLKFLGYQAVYKDPESSFISQTSIEKNVEDELFDVLSLLKEEEPLILKSVQLEQHHTEPLNRYSEGSLVKKLEELGIGRPSTYAPIIKVLQDRNYVTMKSRALHPEFRGRMVTSFLSQYFTELSDYSFTADMENELDNVSAGLTEWKGLLKDYWGRFNKHCDLASSINVRQVEKMMENKFEHVLFSTAAASSRTCPSCSEGTLIFKVSKYGTGYFIGCDHHPKCKYIANTVISEDVDDDSDDNSLRLQRYEPKLLGYYPGSNEKVFFKKGPFGYYVQVGEDRKQCSPRRCPIKIKDNDVDSFTFEDAMEFLRYPLTLGVHPEDKQPVLLTYTKYGFSVKHRKTSAAVPKKTEPKTITLDIALKMLSDAKPKEVGRPPKKQKEKELVV